MSITVVIKQMIMIVFLIGIGFYAYRRKLINDTASRGISALIVNVTNPCLMAYSMLSSEVRISGRTLYEGILSVIITYAFLLIVAWLLNIIFKVEDKEKYCYWMLCVFGNTGFIGIPLTSAVLGVDSLVFVCFHNLLYCLLLYTVAARKIENAAAAEGTIDGSEKKKGFMSLVVLVNVGTVSAVAALVIYLNGLELPDVIMTTMDYAGRATTFLSMVIVGVAVSKMSPKKVLKNVRLIGFSLVRLIVIPVIAIFILKAFIKDDLIICTAALMLAVPAGNMPYIMANRHKLPAETISDGIVLTTLLSVITIPIVTLFV